MKALKKLKGAWFEIMEEKDGDEEDSFLELGVQFDPDVFAAAMEDASIAVSAYEKTAERLCAKALTFGAVLAILKTNPVRQFRRRGWNGKNMSISLHVPLDEHDAMTEPYIYMKTAQPGRHTIPWLASQSDMIADDWEELSDADFDEKGDVVPREE